MRVALPVAHTLLLLAALCCCGCSAGVDPETKPPANSLEMAADFTLPDTAGEPWTLSEAMGKGPVVLVFLRGHW